MRALRKRARLLQKHLEASAEALEDLRSLVQLAAHEIQMCGHNPAASEFLKHADKAIKGQVLEINPYWGRIIHGKNAEIAHRDEEIKKLKEELEIYRHGYQVPR